MSRPLKGTIARTATGWRVEVPAARGSRRRVRHTFATVALAESWKAAAIEALTNDAPLPDPTVQVSSTTDPAHRSFRDAGIAWHHEVHVLGCRADAERANEVLDDINRLANYFDARHLTIDELDRAGYANILHQWAGTVEGPLNKRISIARQKSGITLEGYSAQGVADKRRTLDSVLAYARDVLKVPLSFQPSSVVTPRTTRRRTTKKSPITIAQTGQLCAHLHAVHAVAVLLMRLTGMRISEVYGLKVGDYLSDPFRGRALLVLRGQGGRKFTHRHADGTQFTSYESDSLKTTSSDRAVPLGPHLRHLVETVINIFHVDPDTGELDLASRLVPDLTATGSGQSSLRSALAVAATKAGLSGVNDESLFGVEVALGPHSMRKGLISQLSYTSIADVSQRRFVGHQSSGDSVRRAYLLDGPWFDELAPIADEIDTAIAGELPDGLIIPTSKRCTTRSQPALHARAAFIDAALTDVGWLASPASDDALTVRQVAELLNIAPGTVRKMIRDGDLPSFALAGAPNDQRAVPLDAALAYLEELQQRVPLAELADELGIPRGTIHQLLPRLGLASEQVRGVTVIDPSAADRVREWHAAHVHQKTIGMTHAAAAERLNATVPAIKSWVRAGKLIELPRHGPAAYVTRESVEQFSQTRRSPGRRMPPRALASE